MRGELRSSASGKLAAKYVDVVVKRWQGLRGGKATLESDGRTFDQIAAERHQKAETVANRAGGQLVSDEP